MTVNNNYTVLPETINVHERKAPTDESIRLMEEVHNKTLKNIIAKVSVEDNLVKGEAFFYEYPYDINSWTLIFKFKINGRDFTVEKIIRKRELDEESIIDIRKAKHFLEEEAKAVMLWYTLKMFACDTYTQITGKILPERYRK
jgi:hypothetical protein